MYEVRLQKFLAECGVGSRRKMEEFIKEGRVRVNGQVVTQLGRKINPEVDKVEVNRRPVRAAPKGIVVLNKPRGVVSTLSDPEGRPTVAQFLTKHYASYFPVGRLDYDSTGLMILTNDGEMAERLMHPRYGFERVYEARVEGSVSQAVLDKLHSGVRLSDGMVQADAAVLRSDDKTTWVQVTIKEGRNRVVRRVFEKLGHAVMKLKRTTYGPFKIGRLQVGQARVMTLKEYIQVRRKVMTFQAEAEESKARTRSEAPRRETAGARPVLKRARDDEGREDRGVARPKARPSSRPASSRPASSRPQQKGGRPARPTRKSPPRRRG
jgi:23S rRNA pseudouridine2605 synthase